MPNSYKLKFLTCLTLCRDDTQSWDSPRDRTIIYERVREKTKAESDERASPRDGNVQLAQM